MSNKRFDDILSVYAKNHAPASLHRAPTDETRLTYLANALAKQGVLVLWTDIPANQRIHQADLINDWVSTYGNFYRLLTDALFPSMIHISATYADPNFPPIVILEGHCSPVIEALANYIAPYIALHQRDAQANLAELQGIINFMLEDLEGLDVSTPIYREILSQGIHYITHLMQMPLEQKSLTPFSRQHFQQLTSLPQQPISIPKPVTSTLNAPSNMPPTPPTNAPQTPKPVTSTLTPPTNMPETPKPRPVTAPLVPPPNMPETPRSPLSDSSSFQSSIPIFFETRTKGEKSPRKPPVPPLPKKDS